MTDVAQHAKCIQKERDGHPPMHPQAAKLSPRMVQARTTAMSTHTHMQTHTHTHTHMQTRPTGERADTPDGLN